MSEPEGVTMKVMDWTALVREAEGAPKPVVMYEFSDGKEFKEYPGDIRGVYEDGA